MNDKRLERDISMLCPTCGNTQFEFESSIPEAVEEVKCASCGRIMSKHELLRENSENIEEHAKDMGKAIGRSIANDMKKSLKRAFRGNKNFRIK